jgi:uncharacterized membrane protein
MGYFLRWMHVLALALWLGGGTFFSFFTALPIIQHMEALAQTPDNWAGFRDKAQGTRMAGEALTAVFANYFPYQAICGGLALVTSLAWVQAGGTVARIRLALLAAAWALVWINLLYLSPRVHQLRLDRYAADHDLAATAEIAFREMHQLSLFADLTCLGLVFTCLALAPGLLALAPSHERRPD